MESVLSLVANGENGRMLAIMVFGFSRGKKQHDKRQDLIEKDDARRNV